MTANKHFKRKVRERARRTGESYTAALRHLRHDNPREPAMQFQWQRVEKPGFGYAAHVPHGWEEYPPNLKNSPFETVLGCGSAVPDEDDALFTQIAERFEILGG